MIPSRREQPKQTLPFWRRLRISELGLRVVLATVIVGGGLAYIFLANGVATRGLQVKDLSDRLESLTSQQSVLQAEVDRLQSLSRLDGVVGQLDLVRTASVDFVEPTAGPVAAR